MRLGTVVGGAAVAAIAASLPAAIRMGDGGSIGRAIVNWIALSALAIPMAIVAVAMFRRGRDGLRLLAGERAIVLAAGVLWGCVLEAAFLSIFGALLRAKTHHHGLAGVTFAIAALGSGVVVALLSVRGARMLAGLAPAAQRLGLSFAAVAAFLIVMLVAIRTSRAEGLHTAAGLVDVLAITVASAIASARVFAGVRPLALAGVPVAALFLLIGLVALHGDADLQNRLIENAPLQGWLVELLFR